MKTSAILTNFTETSKCTEHKCDIDVYATGLCKKHYNKYNMRRYRKRYPEKGMLYYFNNHAEELAKRQKKRDSQKNYQREYRRKVKAEVFAYYSNGIPECKLCGLKDMRVLCLDHINNNGREHRRQISPKGHCGSMAVYSWLRKRNYPEGFQVLCHNCNAIKEHERLRGEEL